MTCFTRALIGLTIFMSACATTTASRGDRADGFKIREFQEEILPNGLRILYVEDHSLPKVRVTALVRMGSKHDPDGIEGVSALTARLLEDGNTKMSGPQLAEELAFLGADYGSNTDQEKSFLSIGSLTPNREKALTHFSQILLSPTFAERELQRRKSEIKAGLEKITENPTSYADILLDEAIYGNHPYGRLVSGNVKSLQKISRSDVVRHYFRYFRPNNTWIAVSGDIDSSYKQLLRKLFSGWENGSVPPDSNSPLKESEAQGVRLVSKSGLQQTQIRIGGLGIKRQDPDFLKLRLASLILGGAFESRLNLKIRDELGLTYSIASKFETLKEGGSFEISTFSRNEKVADLITETRKVLADFVKKGVTEKELVAAKNLMISQFPASVETPSETASSLLRLRFYEIPDSYLQNFVTNVSSLSLSEVNEAIQKRLKPDILKTVVFADQNAVAEGLRKLGPVQIESIER